MTSFKDHRVISEEYRFGITGPGSMPFKTDHLVYHFRDRFRRIFMAIGSARDNSRRRPQGDATSQGQGVVPSVA